MHSTTLPAHNKFKTWYLAIRPKTLPAAFMPVAVGSALAYQYGYFTAIPALVTLLCAFLLQIGSNLANDLFDHLSGADTKERKGPLRLVAAGLIPPRQMKMALGIVFGCTFLLGLYLVKIGGVPILIIGILCIIASIAYTGGPYPLGYNGWGDVMAFVFFGLIGTMGTYYVLALSLTTEALIVSIPVGALITNILIVNNYRDFDTDRKAGKRTTVVLFGRKFARIQYIFLLFCAYTAPIIIWLLYEWSAWILLPFVSFPLAIRLVAMMNTLEGRELNIALEQSAKHVALFGILFSIGLSL
jgi:1,4-dihydroxy-2-naphthoate polyprenyltransferase